MVKNEQNKPVSRWMVNIGLILALAIGGYLIASSAWKYYQHQLTLGVYDEEVIAGSEDGATPEERQAAEGKDESQRGDPLAGYQVEPSHPRAIYIEKLGLKARVLPMGVNPDQSIQAPINIFDTGWYTKSAKPGESGTALISGHASGPSREGLFAYVDQLAQGDKIELERGDGSRLMYEVVKKQEMSLSQVDMRHALVAEDEGEWLNLMTCSGEWLKDQATFDKRLTVHTRRIL